MLCIYNIHNINIRKYKLNININILILIFTLIRFNINIHIFSSITFIRTYLLFTFLLLYSTNNYAKQL